MKAIAIFPLNTALTAACFGALIAAASPASAAQELLGNFETWDAYKSKEAQGTVCYVVAEPQIKEPASAKRDPIFLVISTWPGRNVKDQPNIQIGYPFKEGTAAAVTVGADSFSFFTQGDNAWLKTGEDEARFIASLRKGADLKVQGTSKRGTATTDSYSLKGVAAALDKVATACK